MTSAWSNNTFNDGQPLDNTDLLTGIPYLVANGSATAAGGTTARTFASRFAEAVNVLDYGADPTGTANSTSAIQAALTAAGTAKNFCYLPAGTYLVGSPGLTYPSDCLGLVGAGKYASTIKRPNSDSAYVYMLTASGVTSVLLSGFTIDGNKANNTTVSDGALLMNCKEIAVDAMRFQNHLASGSDGHGLWIDGSGDSANGTCSTVTNCELLNNGGNGIEVNGTFANLVISDNVVMGNTSGGIAGQPSASGQNTRCLISGNFVKANGGGIGFAGIASGWNLSASQWVIITNNEVTENLSYGIVWEGQYGTISNNIVNANGNTSPYYYGGILFNAKDSVCSGNVVSGNIGFGIDGGGSQNCVFSGNNILNTYIPTGYGSGNGLNLGAAYGAVVIGNTFSNNTGQPGNQNGTELSIKMYDGGGSYAIIPYAGQNHLVAGNVFNLAASTSWGILAYEESPGIIIKDNYFTGGAASQLISAACSSAVISGNEWSSAIGGYSMAAAAALVVPDFADKVLLTGAATTITSIQIGSQNSNAGKITGVVMTSQGTGYTSAPTATISGDGTGATATTGLNGGSGVGGVNIGNAGSGYTTATIAFSGGGGSGAAATVIVSANGAANGRELTIINASGNPQTFQAGAGLGLASTAVVPDKGIIRFNGDSSGIFREISRSGEWSAIGFPAVNLTAAPASGQVFQFVAPFACFITGVDAGAIAGGGSFTIAVAVAGTTVSGLGAVAVSGTGVTTTNATSATAVSAGQLITITVSSPSGTINAGLVQLLGTKG